VKISHIFWNDCDENPKSPKNTRIRRKKIKLIAKDEMEVQQLWSVIYNNSSERYVSKKGDQCNTPFPKIRNLNKANQS